MGVAMLFHRFMQINLRALKSGLKDRLGYISDVQPSLLPHGGVSEKGLFNESAYASPDPALDELTELLPKT